MKLCIIIEPFPNSGHFSTLEEIRGHVELRGTAHSLGEAQVSVYLKGENIIQRGWRPDSANHSAVGKLKLTFAAAAGNCQGTQCSEPKLRKSQMVNQSPYRRKYPWHE